MLAQIVAGFIFVLKPALIFSMNNPRHRKFQAAQILNQDGQLVAKGTAYFPASESFGWYYPRPGKKIDPGLELHQIEMLSTKAKIYRIENIELCPDSHPKGCDAPQYRYRFDILWERDVV
jgi:hypothetical protein